VRRRLAEVRLLTPAERHTLLLAWVLLLVAPLLLRFVPLSRLLRPHRTACAVGLDPARVARLVEIAARYAPGASCLPVAVVTAWMLARHGARATLRVGVARHADHLAAHAWLECDGRPLLDSAAADGYAPILAVAVGELPRGAAG
jgi:hypothetical protein